MAARKRKDLLTQYSNQLKSIKEKAKERIAELENEGFEVNIELKQLAESKTSDRITKNTLLHDSRLLNLNNIKSHAFKKTDRVLKEGNLSYNLDEAVVQYSANDITKKEGYAKIVNKAVNFASKTIKSNYEFSNLLEALIDHLPVSNIKAGESNQYYEIDNDYDEKKSGELHKHIKFKYIGKEQAAYIDRLLKNPYTSEKMYNEYLSSASNKAYETNVNNLLKSKNIKIDVAVKESLKSIMDSSHSWRVASADSFDSKQTKSKWANLYKNAIEAYNTEDSSVWDTLATMIENEEDYSTIIQFVDDVINKNYE